MKKRIYILKLITDNQPISTHKLDRLFYDEFPFNERWVPDMEELLNDGLVERTQEGRIATEKGMKYLEDHIDELEE